jgi:hypothetical protein
MFTSNIIWIFFIIISQRHIILEFLSMNMLFYVINLDAEYSSILFLVLLNLYLDCVFYPFKRMNIFFILINKKVNAYLIVINFLCTRHQSPIEPLFCNESLVRKYVQILLLYLFLFIRDN